MRDDLKVPKKPAKQPPAAQPDPRPSPAEEPEETIELDDGRPIDEQPQKNPAPQAAEEGRRARLVAWWKSLNRNLRFGIIAAGLVVFCAVVLGIYLLTQPKSQPAVEIIRHPKPAILTVPSPLTGVQVSPKLAARPVTGIMIENSLDARPQSGLQAAGVVYEAIAEAGITRFLALFQESTPQYIGPVRSLRPYFIDYAAPFNASIVHVGGSPDALNRVENGNYRNLDQFFNGGYFWRVASREAPHNVYTSFKNLDKLERSKGYTKSKFVSWPRKADSKLKSVSARLIDFSISSADYHVHYYYQAKTHTYLRSEGGAPHMDLVSAGDKKGVRLTPKVVIALVAPLSNGQLDSSGAYYSNYKTSGSGIAYVFQDGGITKGTWTKEGSAGQLQLTDAGGQPLKLDAGQTWLSLVSSTSQVKYTK